MAFLKKGQLLVRLAWQQQEELQQNTSSNNQPGGWKRSDRPQTKLKEQSIKSKEGGNSVKSETCLWT